MKFLSQTFILIANAIYSNTFLIFFVAVYFAEDVVPKCSFDTCTVTKKVKNMHGILTNHISDILHSRKNQKLSPKDRRCSTKKMQLVFNFTEKDTVAGAFFSNIFRAVILRNTCEPLLPSFVTENLLSLELS